MFAQERRDHIISYLKEKKRIEVKELEEIFQVSGATLRTDLRTLEQEGKLVRTHGGALLKDDEIQKEDNLISRKCNPQKRAIAREAKRYINERETIILDSGSTTLELARELKDAKDLKIITNDLQIALELQENPWIDLYLVGGRVRNRFRLTPWSHRLGFFKRYRSQQSILISKCTISI